MGYPPQGWTGTAVSIHSGAAFPPNPNAGDPFYRTDLHELFIFNGTEWVPWDVSEASYIIFTDGTTIWAKNGLTGDLEFSGTDAATVINNAIGALPNGGKICIREGTYDITSSINLVSNMALVGQGAGTVLRVPDGFNANIEVIWASGVNRVLVADLRVDGNRANQTAGIMRGIHFNVTTHSKVSRCWVENMYGGTAIRLYNSSNNTVTGNTSWGNGFEGIYLYSSSNNTITGNICRDNIEDGIGLNTSSNNTVTGNTSWGNGDDGITIYGSSNNTITGNICRDNSFRGINMYNSSDNNTVTGNTSWGNGFEGIYLYSSSNNTITGNTMVGNSQADDNIHDGILLENNSDYNNIQGNTVRHAGGANQHRYGINIRTADCDGNLVTDNDFYLSGRTANLNNAGTGTIQRGNRGWVTENNVLSPAFAIDAVAVVTVTIPHGLDVTPAAEDCQLTVVEDADVDDWAEGYHKVESVDAANVVAKVNVTAASATGGATAKLLLHVDLAGG